ncbi:P-type conjugative transfer protein TrbL [Caulobacter flavus]|uniref:P-type conjugative transfer protein TrbL n=1 Tax=Caulobacter flavus TaxID=1679497 RepID=A0A2N5CX47_9CAUL|nr:P-type conjugative transfer protein TrbL [Caulobacter flavus]AYV47541.1 P-type conjugative transfer protein TrbL [Caulobacter flavus]PLR18382.1 P-type conjugative transfer protein TrbL [Caulobacter flavus]
MNDTGVIDRFFDVYGRYIDSGFGLLGGEVAFLSTTLVAIDVTLAALFWAWAHGEDIIARLVKKTLYVGFFAFLIGNFHTLTGIVLKSFSGLGLKAGGVGTSAEDFLRPGKLAALGVEACKPILQAASDLGGFPGFFENIVQILILLIVAILVIVSFFIIAVQIFVVLIEFKLVSLCGFVLVPFGLFGRTAFLAEKVLGNVMASGVKVMVLAVIVGIGSTLFSQFTSAASGQPTLEEVLAMALAALTMLGLSIFGPGIASGLVSGAPQLGVGAAVGTGMVVGGMAMAAAGAAQMAAGAASGVSFGGMGGGAAGAAGAGGGRLPPPSGGPAPPSGGGPSGPPGPPTPGDNSGGGRAGFAMPPPKASDDDGGGGEGGSGAPVAPAWARDLADRNALVRGAEIAAHAADGGGHSGGDAAPSLKEE